MTDTYYRKGYHVVVRKIRTTDRIYEDYDTALASYDRACKRAKGEYPVMLIHRPSNNTFGRKVSLDFLFFNLNDPLDRVNYPNSNYRDVSKKD